MACPPVDAGQSEPLTLRVTARENSNGSVTTTESTFHVQVEAVADAPVVQASAAATEEDRQVALNLSAALTDLDGSETLSVSILGLPAGATLSHGTRQADGSWSVDVADLSRLTLTPPENFSGTLDLTLQARARESSRTGSR